jgi:hypothetical protein
MENPDNGTTTGADGVGVGASEGGNVGATGALVARFRLTADGAVEGELEGTVVVGLREGRSGRVDGGDLDGECSPLLDFFPGATRVGGFRGLLLPINRRYRVGSFVEPLSSV